MGLREPQHRLCLCAGLLLFLLLIIQQSNNADAYNQNEDDLTFDALHNGGRSSRSLEHVNSESSQEDEDHWLTKSIHRIKRGLFDFWSTEKTDDDNNKVEENNSHEEQSQKLVDSAEKVEPHTSDGDDYEELVLESRESNVHHEPLIDSGLDDDEDFANSGSGSESPPPIDEQVAKHPVYFRLRFTLMEPFKPEFDNPYSDTYKRLSEQIVDNVDQLFKDIGGNQTSTVVKIQKRKEDMFSSLVTIDIQSENYSNSNELRKKIWNQILNYNIIGSLSVKADDFLFQAFEARENNICSDDEVQCKSGECVPNEARCDNKKDCSDGTDEEDCPACAVGEMSCDISRCIPQGQRCDGFPNCEDKTDELNCPVTACHPGQFRCNNGQCIDNQQRCDGTDDCQHREDEEGCPPKNGRCIISEYQCGDGRCIPKSKQCDSHYDCADQSDEKYCPCTSNEFTCAPGICIPIQRQCDGTKDCSSGQDERNCAHFNRTTHGLCQHHQRRCHDGSCIDQILFCDGRPDCSDHSDEHNCCLNDQFRCSNGTCLTFDRQCNGIADCEHGEDEDNCVTCPNKFRCACGDCIDLKYQCNGYKDCPDGSDEERCHGYSNLKCSRRKFKCANNEKCIKLTARCNGIHDCSDGSDERLCKEYTINSDASNGGVPANISRTDRTGVAGCSRNEFECAAGYCIEDYKRCNGIQDCPSGNDEEHCPTTSVPNMCTGPRLFLCNTGQCIDIIYRCDTYADCFDGSDEHNCAPTECNKFKCHDGSCVEAFKCDGIFDCVDGTDESDCGVCSPDQFKCKTGVCIPEDQRCNNNYDCADGSDESDCVQQCRSHEFRCTDGLCVDSRRVCDGYPDCRDGSDEHSCRSTCKEDEFKCNNNDCISDELRCDGFDDCTDSSDEENCSQSCHADEFECDPGVCIPSDRKCDGKNDCDNGLDEFDCPTTSRQCRHDEHRCSDGSCILRSHVCDGIPQCYDRSDEKDCGVCGPREFECRDGQCIPDYLRCNSQPDCSDGSDEHHCETPAPPVEPEDPYRPPTSGFYCRSGERPCRTGRHCYLESKHCDHRPDCPDMSDEDNCHETPCTHEEFRCENGPCIHKSGRCNGINDCPMDQSDELDCSDKPYNGSTNGLDLRTYPNQQEIKESREVVFQCRDEGPLRAAVRWTRGDGLPLPPRSRDVNGRLEMPNIQRNHSGTYICSAIGIPSHTPGAQVQVHLDVNPSAWRSGFVKYGVLPPIDTEYHGTDVAPTARPSQACGLHQSTCANGECIDKHLVCNGREDCSDGSDETRCNPHGCEPNEFRCPNKRCILKTWVCDSEDDCGDGGDEVNCGERKPGEACSPVQYACKSGNQCIPKSFHCDQNNDCNDGSDEIGCMPVNIMRPPPPMIHLEVGQTFQITCTAVGIPVPEITWRLNWGHIPEKCQTTSINGVGTLICQDIQESDQGAYSCEGINIKGSVLAVPDTILVVNPPTGVCPKGFFNSEARSPSECISCFCFGVTAECKSANLFTYHLPPPFDAHKALGVRIDPQSGVVDIRDEPIYKGAEPRLVPVPGRNGVHAQLPRGELLQPNVIPYFALPENYHGNQLKSYGGYMNYQLHYEGQGNPINAPDVILMGNGYTLLHIGQHHNAGQREEVIVRFFFGEWVKRSESRPETVATREEIMMTLESVENILIKLQYVEGHLDTTINKIEMDSAGIRNTGLGNASFVEECICPTGHGGLSCETCDAGYSRHRMGPWLGKCYREVETCPSGYYGDPSRGIACQICPCPLTDPRNQFATTCQLDADGEVTCNCPPEYMGRRCERCSRGYTGNPLLPGDSCKPVTSRCSAEGSTGIDAYGQCQCKINTAGSTCGNCKNNTFHLAADNQFGCVSCFCMGITDQCISSNWYRASMNAAFTRSKQDFKLVESNSKHTQIDDGIILDSNAREIVYNNFRRPDVYYWSLPPMFLGDKVTSYGGNLKYSLRYVPTPGGQSSKNNAPDVELISENHITLTYFARDQPSPNTVQSFSVPLLEQYWQRSDGQKTDREHLMMALADVKTILIKATYTTNTREAALQSVSLDIAQERNTGNERAMPVEQCYCPPGYKGLSCHDCDVGYTRTIGGIYLGTCEPCQCNGLSSECHAETGDCFHCRDYSTGPNCESCLPGYEGDPSNRIPCRYTGEPVGPCRCDPHGSISNDCMGGVCQCKTNVEGENCDRCREGTFGLNASIIEGCQSCFCSGVATECRESNMYITQIPSHILDEYTHGFTLTDPSQTERISNAFELNIRSNEIGFTFRPSTSQRLYWSLPTIFTGSKITSYGGKLEFTQRYTQRAEATYIMDQDVIINGHGISIYWTNPAQQQPNIANKVSVTLSPSSKWQRLDHRLGPRPASREDILKVLANVNSVLIRAQLSTDTQSSFISDVTLDTALEQNTGQPKAINVEVCSCPLHYSGTSCESCSLGYYRDFNDIAAGPLGSCNKCPCNNNERSCHFDYESGVVCECREGFTGRYCEHRETVTAEPPIDPYPPHPTITVSISAPSLTIQEVGRSVSYTCSATSTVNKDVRLNWSKAQGSLPNRAIDDRRGRLVITNLQVSDSGTYICKAEDGVSIVEEVVSLAVGDNVETVPQAMVWPTYLNVSVGEPVEIRCSASGYPAPRLEFVKVTRDRLSPHSFNNGVFRIDRVMMYDQGEYECIATNTRGTHSMRTMIVVKDSGEPTIEPTISPKTYYGATGETFTLLCEAGGAQRSISWSKQHGHLPYSNRDENGVLIISNARPEDSGVYICSVTNSAGSVGRAYANVTIVHTNTAQAPTVHIAQNNERINEGSDTEIRCEFTGSPTPIIKWTKLNEQLPDYVNPADPLLRLKDVRVHDRGIYICVARNDLGMAQSSVVIEVDRRVPPSISIYPNTTQSVTTGDRVMVQCRVIEGEPQPELTWSRFDDRPITNRATIGRGMLSIQGIRPEDAGEYKCTAENVAGSVSAIASIIVREPPTVSINPHGPTLNVQRGEFVRLECTGHGNPQPSVEWTEHSRRNQYHSYAQGYPGYESYLKSEHNFAVKEITQVTEEDEGIYICTATSEAGVTEERITLNVNNDIPTRGDITDEDPGTSGEPSFKDNELPRPLDNQTFTVPVGNRADLRCNMEFNDREPISTNWKRLDNKPMPSTFYVQNDTLTIDNAQPSDAGEYICLGMSSTTNKVVFRVIANLKVLSEDELCALRAIPRIKLHPAKQVVRPGADAHIECTATGDQPIRISWTGHGRELSQSVYARDGLLQFRGIQLSDAGRYRCTATNSVGEADAVAEVVVEDTVHQPPTAAREQTAEAGSTVTLHCNIGQNVANPSYRWYRENHVLPQNAQQGGTYGEELKIYDITNRESGRYYCEIVSEAGAPKDYVTLHVSDRKDARRPQKPALDIHASNDAPQDGDNVEVHCRSNEPGVIVSWSKVSGRVADNVVISGGQLRFTSIRPENNGAYRCEARGYEGFYHKDHFININEEDPDENIVIKSAPEGATVILKCQTQLDPPVSFMWTKEKGNLPRNVDAQSSSIQLHDVGANDAGTYVCTSSNHYKTIQARNILRIEGIVPYFTQAPSSYIKLAPLPDSHLQFNIEISFKPEDHDGLILYDGNKKNMTNGDFISLALRNGIPEFKYNLGQNYTVTTVTSERPLTMREWHTIKIIRMRRKVTMYVDGEGPFTGVAVSKFSSLTLSEPLYLGGVPSFDEISPLVGLNKGMVGCIASFKIDNTPRDISKEAQVKKGITNCETCSENPCQNRGVCQEALTKEGFTCICSSGFSGSTCHKHGAESCTPHTCGIGTCIETDDSYQCKCPIYRAGRHCEKTITIEEPAFSNNAYIAYPTPNQVRRLKISMKIKPKDMNDGLIAYCGESEEGDGDFVSLAIKDRHLEFRFDVGNGPVVIRSEKELIPNKMVIITASRSLNDGRLVVNGDNVVIGKSTGIHRALNLRTPFYVGGYDAENIKLNEGIEVSDGFHGCITEISVSSLDIHALHSATDASNVQDCSTLDEDIDPDNDIDGISSFNDVQNYDTRRTGCSSHPCRNDGQCYPLSPTEYKCSCVNGYAGIDCEIAPNQCDQLNPCQNHGTCHGSTTQYICHCPMGYTGINCEMTSTIRNDANFNGDGYIEFNKELLRHDDDDREEVIALELSTNSSKGLIFWQGQGPFEDSQHDFIALALINGYLEFSYDLGTGPAIILNDKVRIDDGSRHKVILKRRGRDGSIEVDNDFIVEGESQGITNQMNCNGNIYLGGTPNNVEMTGHRYPDSFKGCIHGFELQDSRSLDLGSVALSGVNVKACYRHSWIPSSLIFTDSDQFDEIIPPPPVNIIHPKPSSSNAIPNVLSVLLSLLTPCALLML